MNRDDVNHAVDSLFSFPAMTEAANYFFFVFKDQRIHTGCAVLLNEGLPSVSICPLIGNKIKSGVFHFLHKQREGFSSKT